MKINTKCIRLNRILGLENHFNNITSKWLKFNQYRNWINFLVMDGGKTLVLKQNCTVLCITT